MLDENENLKSFYGIEETPEEPGSSPNKKEVAAPKKGLFDRLAAGARELVANVSNSPKASNEIFKLAQSNLTKNILENNENAIKSIFSNNLLSNNEKKSLGEIGLKQALEQSLGLAMVNILFDQSKTNDKTLLDKTRDYAVSQNDNNLIDKVWNSYNPEVKKQYQKLAGTNKNPFHFYDKVTKSNSLDDELLAPIGSLSIDSDEAAKKAFAEKKASELESARQAALKQAELKAQEIAIKKQIQEAEKRLIQEKQQKIKQEEQKLKDNQEQARKKLNISLVEAALNDDIDQVKAIISIPGYKVDLETLRESIEFTVPAKTNSKAIATVISNIAKNSDVEIIVKEFAKTNKLAQINNLQDAGFFKASPLNNHLEALVALNTISNNNVPAKLMLDQLSIAQKTFGTLPVLENKANVQAKANFEEAVKNNKPQEIVELLKNDHFKNNIFPSLIENGLRASLENGKRETFLLISNEAKGNIISKHNEAKIENILNQYSTKGEIGKLSKALEFNPDIKSLINAESLKLVESFDRIKNPGTVYQNGNSLIKDIRTLEAYKNLKNFEGESLSSSLKELPHISARASTGLEKYIKMADTVSNSNELMHDLVSFAKYSKLTENHPALKTAIECSDIKILNVIKSEYKKQNNGQEIPAFIVKEAYKECLIKGDAKKSDFIVNAFKGHSLNTDQKLLKEAINEVKDPKILLQLATSSKYQTGESITDIKIFKTCIDYALEKNDTKALSNLFANEQFGKLIEDPKNAKQVESILKDEIVTDLLLDSKDLKANANLQKAVHELSKTLEKETNDLTSAINKLTLKDFKKENIEKTIKTFEAHIENGANATNKETLDALVKKQSELTKKNEGIFGKKNQNLDQGLATLANRLQKSSLDNRVNKMRQNLSNNHTAPKSAIPNISSKSKDRGR